MLFACLMIGLMMLMDRSFLSAEFSDRSILLRVVFMLPPLLTLFALTWTRHLKYWIQPMGVIAGLSVGLTSLMIGAIAARYGQPRVFAGYQIIIVFVYFFLGLRLPAAVATAVSLFAAFVIAAVLNSANPVSFAYNGLYLLFLNVFLFHWRVSAGKIATQRVSGRPGLELSGQFRRPDRSAKSTCLR